MPKVTKYGRYTFHVLLVDEAKYIYTNRKPKKRRYLPASSSNILLNWFKEHIDNPYPTKQEKEKLAREANIDHMQLYNWLKNARSKRGISKKEVH